VESYQVFRLPQPMNRLQRYVASVCWSCSRFNIQGIVESNVAERLGLGRASREPCTSTYVAGRGHRPNIAER